MKPLVFDRSGWLFRFTQKLTNYHPRDIYDSYSVWGDSPDICTYTRHVIYAVLLVSIYAVVTVGAAYIAVEMLFSLAFSLFYGVNLCSVLAIICWGVFLVMILACMLVGALCMFGDWMNNRRYIEKPDGFIKQSYKSWKGKYCIPIAFVDSNASEKDITNDTPDEVISPLSEPEHTEPAKEWVQEEMFDNAPPTVGIQKPATEPANIDTPDEDNPAYQQLLKDRADAKWKTHADVHWGDLAHFLEIARNSPSSDAFNTALRVLEGIKQQVMEQQ